MESHLADLIWVQTVMKHGPEIVKAIELNAVAGPGGRVCLLQLMAKAFTGFWDNWLETLPALNLEYV